MNKWFAYRRINGGIKVKRYFEASYEDAMDSDFVDGVTSVFEADSREEAEEIGKEELGGSDEIGAHVD